MALVLKDRIKETTATTGTGTYSLEGAEAGFQGFSAVGDGNTCYYACTDNTDFEVGIGTFTASGSTLARTTILESSNSDAAVNWGAGSKDIFVTAPADKLVYEDAAGNITVSGTVDGRDLATDGTKLDGIEAGATADQTDAEIRAAVEAATDSNVFTDADHSKLNAIEASADVTDTANVVAALIAGTNVSIDNDGTISATDTNTTYTSSDFNHDDLTGFVANEHIDWTASSVGSIHLTNLPATALTTVQTASSQSAMLALTTQEGDVVVRSDENKTYMHNGGSAGTMADFTLLATPTDAVTSVDGATGAITLNHDTLTGFVANEHIDWTTDQGAANIHAGNYTDTTYTDATTSASGLMSASDKTKLDGVEDAATADQTASEIRTLVESASDSNVFTDADHSKLDGIEASADVTDATNVTAAGALMDSELTSEASVKALDQGVATTDAVTHLSLNIKNGSSQNSITSGGGYLQYNADTSSNQQYRGHIFKIRGVDWLSMADYTTASEDKIFSRKKHVFDNGAEVTGNISFEGATANAYETILTVTDPTADRTITLPNATGTVALTSDVSSYMPLSGGTFTGDVTFEGADFTNRNVVWDKTDSALEFADNAKIVLGQSSDLQIFHDAQDSYIQANVSGHLYLRNATDDYDVVIQSDSGAGGISDYFRADGSTGEALLYHYGTEKLASKVDGVVVTGSLEADQLHVDSKFQTNSGGITVTGNIIVNADGAGGLGLVDGVDIAARDGVLTSTTTTANAAMPTTGGTFSGDIDLNGTLDLDASPSGYLATFNQGIASATAHGISVTTPATAAHDANILRLNGDGEDKFVVKSSGNVEAKGDVTLLNTGDGSAISPNLNLKRDSASPAAWDWLGAVRYLGEDSASNEIPYASIAGRIVDPTAGAEDGRLEIWLRAAGVGTLAYGFDNDKFQFGNNQPLRWDTHNGTSYDVDLIPATPTGNRTITLPDQTGTAMLWQSAWPDDTGTAPNYAIGDGALNDLASGGEHNVAYGYQALEANTTGDQNVAIGNYALFDAPTQSGNTAVGYNAGRGYSTQSGTFVGAYAGNYNTSSKDHQTAVGYNAMNDQSGDYTTAVGSNAMTDGVHYASTAVGFNALGRSSTWYPYYNTAVGNNAGDNVYYGDYLVIIGNNSDVATTGYQQSITIGHQSLISGNYSVSVGTNASSSPNGQSDHCTFIGQNAGFDIDGGDYCTFVGSNAGYAGGTGNDNTTVGVDSLHELTSGQKNSSLGRYSLRNVTSGDYNCSLGNRAAYNLTTGSNNTFLGHNAGYIQDNYADTALTTGSNVTCVGSEAVPSSVSATNEITLGDNDITSLRCNVQTISSLSDERDKTSIADLTYGLDFINDMRPVEFTWNRRDGSLGAKPDMGFIAQELYDTELDHSSSSRTRLVNWENPEKLEADYVRSYPILVKAVQELSAQVTALQARIETLEGN